MQRIYVNVYIYTYCVGRWIKIESLDVVLGRRWKSLLKTAPQRQVVFCKCKYTLLLTKLEVKVYKSKIAAVEITITPKIQKTKKT